MKDGGDNVIRHRRIEERDGPFVLRSYLESYWQAQKTDRCAKYASVLPGPIWFRAHREAFLGLLQRPEVHVLVAVNPKEEDPSHEIYGFVVYEEAQPPVVHFAYVKHAFRRKGVFKYLLWAAGVRLHHRFLVSHTSHHWLDILKHYREKRQHLNVHYDPRLAWGRPERKAA